MIIKNGAVLIGKRFVKLDVQFNRLITAIDHIKSEDEVFDAEGCYVLPGLVDIHTHGALGEDFSDGKGSGLQIMANYYASNGTTSFLATTMSLKEKDLFSAMHTIRAFRGQGGAKCAGIHLEGPFLSAVKRGAQAANNLRFPEVSLFDRLNEQSGNAIKIITVACEEPGAAEFIRYAAKLCTVSLGHTDADYSAAIRAFELGATHVTHLYNGMPPLHHRKPGVVGAAFDAGVSIELICDGLHIHPAVVRSTYAMFGERLNLISDSVRCAGMPDGDYELGGQPIQLRKGVAVLANSDTLAGSAISLLDGLRNAVKYGIPLEAAAYAASTAPSKVAGLNDIGAVEVGRRADLIVLTSDLNLKAVFVDGVRQ